MNDARASIDTFWAGTVGEWSRALGTTDAGLSVAEAAERLSRGGPNTLREKRRSNAPALLLRQFSSPIVLILLAAAVLAFAVHDRTDAVIILVIVGVSSLIAFWQEYRATAAVESLMALVELRADVVRGGGATSVPVEELVPGDLVMLSAGSSVPADCRLLEARDLFVDEATLTGETFPVEKSPRELPAETPLAGRTNALFLGTHVVSGSGRALVVHTGRSTEFGAISQRLRSRPEETEFEHGVRSFGSLLVRVTLLLVVGIFAINVYLERPVVDSFLFALALAVGLTPEMLPAVISVNLAVGARRMAAKKVVVKRLASIENFGSMDVLCSDKTGTLTEGSVRLEGAVGVDGAASDRSLRLAAINAGLQQGFRNPIDEAIRAAAPGAVRGVVRLDEIPYDFLRKRLSVLANVDGESLLVTKGALQPVLAACSTAASEQGGEVPLETVAVAILDRYAAYSARGLRTLGLAVRSLPGRTHVEKSDEAGLCFLGFLLFADPPRPGIDGTLAELRHLGVALKVVTGDNALVAREIATRVGLGSARILTGAELRGLSDDALPKRAVEADIFAEIEPNQKERLIRALRKAGHVVGYLGDGINDAPALHAADVGLSVQGAVDVAREAADIVLLEPDLAVLVEGVREGRRTFANTMKYVFMATSANFGNMFSMAGASLLLPFLPLLPKQILLTNLLTDLPEMTIATDRVDADWIELPRRWDVRFIRDYMVAFGLLSSVFDFLTFGVLLLLLDASPELFRSGWFVESVVSATLIVLVIRTRGPFASSRPSLPLAGATLVVTALAVAVPYTPIGPVLGFVPLPPVFLGLMGFLVVAYLGSAEVLKRRFFRRHEGSAGTSGGTSIPAAQAAR